MTYIKNSVLILIVLMSYVSMASAVSPEILNYNPSSDPVSSVGSARYFDVLINQTITSAKWYINGTLKETDTGGYVSSYTNLTAGAQDNSYNITVVIIGSNGVNSTSRMWNWTVLPLVQPGITGYAPATDPSDLNTSSRTFNVTANQTGTFVWKLNGTTVLTETGTESTYTNSTAGYQPNGYNVSVYFTSTNGTASRMWNWSRTIAPTISAVSPVADTTTTTTNSDITTTFSVLADRTANTSWTLNGVQFQYNTSQTAMNYTNSTAGVGTYTVTATVNNSNGTGNTLAWTWVVQQSMMSARNISTNLSSIGRIKTATNGTYNFTWTDTGYITRVNFSFPTTFKFSALSYQDITSNLGNITSVTLDESTGLISIYNATGLNNSNIYVNFTGRLTSPAASSDNTVTVTTNKNPTGATFTISARDTTKPYLAAMNNSLFAVGAETYGTLTTTVPLTGTGATNLTFYAPNVTGQTNITAGYGATNSSKVTVVYTGGTAGNSNGNYTIYVETDPSVFNPIVVLSAPTQLQSSNLPTGLIAGGLISGAIIVYAFRRRRH